MQKKSVVKRVDLNILNLGSVESVKKVIRGSGGMRE